MRSVLLYLGCSAAFCILNKRGMLPIRHIVPPLFRNLVVYMDVAGHSLTLL